MPESEKKRVLFAPRNSVGHLNGCYGLADRLATLDCEIYFLMVGEPIQKPRGQHKEKFHILTIADSRLQAIADSDKKEVMHKQKTEKVKGFVREAIESNIEDYAKFIFGFLNLESVTCARLFNADYEQIIGEVKPDLIIYDTFYPMPALTNYTKWAAFISANPLTLVNSKINQTPFPVAYMGTELLSKAERQELRENHPEKWLAMLDKWTADKKTLEDAMNALDDERSWNKYAETSNALKCVHGQMTVLSPHINLYMYPKALDYDQDDDLFEYGSNCYNVESSVDESGSKLEPRVEKKWLDSIAALRALPGNADKPLVYFSLGSLASGDETLMQRFVKYMSHDKEHLFIVSKGINGDLYELNSANMIGENFVPQLFLLQQVQLAIIHGGNNSTTEALHFGVPCIVVPIFGDQPDNAQRFVDLKLGEMIRIKTVTKDELLSKIKKLLENKNLRQRCKQIGADMRARNECLVVAKKIVELIS